MAQNLEFGLNLVDSIYW